MTKILIAALLALASGAAAAPAARDAAPSTSGSVHALMGGAVAGAKRSLGRPRLLGIRGFFPSLPRGASERWTIAFHRADAEGRQSDEYCGAFTDAVQERSSACDASFSFQHGAHLAYDPIAVSFVDSLAVARSLSALGVRPNSKGQYWAWLFSAKASATSMPPGMRGFMLGRPFPKPLRGRALWGVNNDEEVFFFDAESGKLVHRFRE